MRLKKQMGEFAHRSQTITDAMRRDGQKQDSPVLPSLNKKEERGMIGTDNGALSVDDLTCFVAVLVDERLVVLGHATERHTHA